jgi:hypothetical protein
VVKVEYTKAELAAIGIRRAHVDTVLEACEHLRTLKRMVKEAQVRGAPI